MKLKGGQRSVVRNLNLFFQELSAADKLFSNVSKVIFLFSFFFSPLKREIPFFF